MGDNQLLLNKGFYLGVGCLLLCEGILGVFLYIILNNVETIAWGITFTIGGIFYLLLIIFKPEAEARAKPIIKWNYFSVLCFGFGIVCLVWAILRYDIGNIYLSGVILSWGGAAAWWVLMKRPNKEKKIKLKRE